MHNSTEPLFFFWSMVSNYQSITFDGYIITLDDTNITYYRTFIIFDGFLIF